MAPVKQSTSLKKACFFNFREGRFKDIGYLRIQAGNLFLMEKFLQLPMDTEWSLVSIIILNSN